VKKIPLKYLTPFSIVVENEVAHLKFRLLNFIHASLFTWTLLWIWKNI